MPRTRASHPRASQIITNALDRQDDIVGIYILSSEARSPLSVIKGLSLALPPVIIAHERTPYTENALKTGALDAMITQDPGHLVRSAIRKLRAMTDMRTTLQSQEKIRVEILLKTNL